VKLGVRIIHRIINFCTTATLKTGVAYYTRVRIILEILRYVRLNRSARRITLLRIPYGTESAITSQTRYYTILC